MGGKMAFRRESFKIDKEINKPSQEINTLGKEQLSVPLVVTLENNSYHGFVPGIVMKDITDTNLNSCKEKLFLFATKKIKEMILQKKKLPYFPDNDMIKQDFENVIFIKRLTLEQKNLH